MASGVPPAVPGRRPPPSGPPPIPSRVDLGEAPANAANSIKEQSKDELPKKVPPKSKPKGRPEISIVSARPMDSTGVIPPPSVPSQPVAEPEMPTVPQKPSRKPKGREPPPRPKSRPVSELTTGEDEQDVGVAVKEREKEEGEVKEKEATVARIAPVVPVRKIPEDKSEASNVSVQKQDMNLEDKAGVAQRMEHEVEKDDSTAKKPVKPTVFRGKPKEDVNQSNSTPEVKDVGVIETKSDSNAVSVENAISTAKKSKPTVIIAAKPPKKNEAEKVEEKGGEDEGKEPGNEKTQAITTSQGQKPPPPTKKPKPAVKAKPGTLGRASKPPIEENKPDSTAAPKLTTLERTSKPPIEEKHAESTVAPKPIKAKPLERTSTPPIEENKPDSAVAPKPVKAKPSGALERTSTPPIEENKTDGTVAAPKPKMRPTVIVASKPPKTNDTVKPDEESSKKKVEDQPQVKSAAVVAPADAIQDARDEEKTTTAPVAKPKRVPTIIRAAPRPDAQDSGGELKAPKRPQRGPSIKAAPRRPVSAPAEENEGQEKDNENLKDEKKAAVVEELDALTRKGSRKRPPPPRPPTVKQGDLSPETQHKTQHSEEKSKGKTRPPPPRPPTAEHGGEKVDLSPETQDKIQHSEEKSRGKTRPPAPRPPTAEHAGERVDLSPESDEKSKEKTRPPPPRPPVADGDRDKLDSSEVHDKTETQDPHEKLKKKNRPPRPSSKVLDDKHPKHTHEETEESHVHEKAKPVRPAPVAPSESHAAGKNVHVTETRTVAQSSADDHVQETSHARDSADVHDMEKSEKASSKAKPRPARPAPSVGTSTKSRPHRPSAPTEKATTKPAKKSAPTQVSSVCETYIEPSAIALYDYEPSAMDDLSFSAGDEITLVKRIDNEWYIGRLGNQEGMFPVKFVEIIEDLPQLTEPETKPVKAPETSPFDVTSLYDFHGNEQDGELVFTAGEIIHVIEKINHDWLRGEYRGRTGSFPCNFVDISLELISKLPQSKQTETAAKTDEGKNNDLELDLQCKALFDYDSHVPDDLSFHAGDVIRIKKKISEEWFEGEIHGRVGMFPSAYVEIIKDAPKEKIQTDKVPKHHVVEYGTALYDFTGSAADELSFKKGDKIEITERVGDDWLRGKLGGKEGMLPKAFVQLSKAENGPDTQSVTTHKKPTPKAKALFDFDGEYEDELSFRTGDVIVLLERVNDEWFKGEINKRVGRFPAAFVEILTPLS